MYWRKNANAPYADWDDFSPIVVNCLVDLTQGRAAMERLNPMAWKALEVAVASLERCDQPGLYTAIVPPMIVRNCS